MSTGVTQSVELLEFSQDARFLAASGEDRLVYVWDTQTGEVVFGKRFAKKLAVLQWLGGLDRDGSLRILVGF